MCVVSMVSDHEMKTWEIPVNPLLRPGVIKYPTKEEVEEFYRLLEAARKIDTLTGQPDCPSDDKVAWLARFKELVHELYGHLENEPQS